MRFTLSSSLLSNRLQTLAKVINSKNALPILDSFLFEVRNNQIIITASDSETVMKSTIVLDYCDGEGTFAVPNRTYVTPGWKNYASTIQTVIFDSSFATALPVSSYLWFGDCSNLEEIQGLENLNTSSMTQMTLMFSRCTKLVSLDLSHFDTSNVTSMDYMFDSCTKLKDVNLTSFDTKKLESTGYMFKNCISLEVLDLSSFTMGSIIVSAEGMFDGCSKLKTIYVNSAWDNSTWIYKGNLMFRGCTSLVGGAGTSWSESYINADFACIDRCPPSYNLGYMTLKPEGYAFFSTSNNTLTFYCDDQLFKRTGGTAYSLNVGSNDPGWSAIASQVNKVVLDASFADARPTTIYKWFDRMSNLTEITDMKYLNTSEVTNMGFLFSGCQKLASVDLSRFDTRKVKTMCMIFDKCWELKTLDVSSFNTENVKDFSWMFNDCNQLKVIDLTGFDTRSGTCTNGMFSQCSSLTTIYVGDAWKMDNIHDSSQMFQGCSSSLVGGAGTVWSTSHIDGEYARIDGADTPGYFTSDPGYAVYDAESKELTFYCDGRKAEKTGMKFSLNTPGTQPMWLQNGICDEVTKVVFDGSFGRAYPKTTAHWFRSMDQLSSIENLDILDTREVTSMDHMFAYCEKLASIDVSHFDTRNVTSMASTFEGCRRVKSLDLSNFDTSNVKTMYCMFRVCYWLEDVNLSSFNTGNVNNMTNMFYACGKLTTLNLASFNTSNVTYSQSMFEDCTELTTVYVSRLWDMSNCYGPYMFINCPKLKGGAGTVWASTNSNDNTYAHIDGGTSNPGYLTQAPAEAYAIYTESDHTLTFYYDRARYVRSGKSFTLNSGDSTPGWYSAGLSGNTTRVVFDSSFADARPTTTKDWFVAMFDLTSIEGMENLNTSEVTNMKGMFSLCRNLESVDVSGFDTQKVTTTNGLFNECNSLQSVDLSGFNTINVTDMQQMFYGCTSLTTLDLTSFNTENVTLTPWMFYGCDHLKTVYVSDGFKVENVGQHTCMFEGCTSIVGGNGTTYDASHIDKEYAIIDGINGNPGYFTAKPYAVYNLDTQLLTLYNDGKPNEKTGKKFYLNAGNSMPGWVEVRTDIKKVIFHESFASARPTSTYYWFGEMPNLQEIEGLELLNTSEVTNMEAMFGNYHKAGELDLSHFDTHKVTSMKSMFWGCQNITTIYVSNAWNTNNVTDGWGMFYNCRNLVGGMGTEWKEDNYDYQDLVYAHIDGGTSNPGYFTQGPAYALIGDVNGDMKVNVADVTALVNMLKSGNVVYNEVADVDGDGSITNIDVKALVYNILGSYALMYVEDVFTITGRGTVATGQILKGMFRTGQTAVLRSISDAIADVEFTISGIEKFQQTVDVAVAGDNVGILVPVDKANVQRGDVLTIKNNPELRHGKTVKGTLYVLTKDEGGRHTPFFVNYSPQMYVAGGIFTVKCTNLGFVDGQAVEMITPGSTSENIVFEVIEDGKTPYVYPGQVVLLREGGRTIGRLTITE